MTRRMIVDIGLSPQSEQFFMVVDLVGIYALEQEVVADWLQSSVEVFM